MRTITREQLSTILADHRLWSANESQGKRADLRWANLTGATLTGATLAEERQYSLSYRWDGKQLLLYAGCRAFTLDQAIAHWGSPDYPDPKRGQRYVKTCQFLHDLNESGLLLGGKDIE